MSIRALVTLATILLASEAVADDKADAEAVVRKHLTLQPLASDARILVHGASAKSDTMWRELGGGRTTAYAVDKLSLEVVASPGADVAWFHGVGKLTVDGKPIATRFNGIASSTDKGWKVVAVSHSRVTPDAEVVARANKLATKLVAPAKPKLSGDQASAECVSTWLASGGLAKGIGAGTPIASGTSATEHWEGAKGAAKLAGSWDAIKLRPVEVEATQFGMLYWVRALAVLPIAGQKHGAPLVLTAVVQPTGMSCTWSSLHWADHTPASK